MITPEGKVVGRHEGLMYYTLGQRQGLKNRRQPREQRRTMVCLLPRTWGKNELIVVQGHEHPLLLNDGLKAGQLHWISEDDPKNQLGVCSKNTLSPAGCALRN